jgi:hypothetical protein
MLDLINQEDSYTEQYAYVIPYKNGKDYAWLHETYRDIRIFKNDVRWYKSLSKKLKTQLEEIKSGKGNWIVSPGQSSYGVDWKDLDYSKASVVKRVLKTTVQSIGELS